jgi:hypothetical protein
MRNGHTVALEAQGSLLALAIRRPAKQRRGGGVRGDVQGFSRASRLRLIRKLARLTPTNTKFVTLTYPDASVSAQDAKKHLRAFLERIRRKYPKTSAVWRLEFQQRGTPHFHLLMFNLPYVPFIELREMWRGVIGLAASSPLFVRIELVRSARGVMRYASKYLAKETPSPEQGTALLDYDAYLHAGRVWGVFNAQNLPLAVQFFATVVVTAMRNFWDAKRLMRHFFARLAKERFAGGCIFAGDTFRLACEVERLLCRADGD